MPLALPISIVVHSRRIGHVHLHTNVVAASVAETPGGKIKIMQYSFIVIRYQEVSDIELFMTGSLGEFWYYQTILCKWLPRVDY